jgi:hypothetical protein
MRAIEITSAIGIDGQPHDWLHLKHAGRHVTICGATAAAEPEAIPLCDWGAVAEGVEWCPHCRRLKIEELRRAAALV